jgi:hypothetical protein
LLVEELSSTQLSASAPTVSVDAAQLPDAETVHE